MDVILVGKILIVLFVIVLFVVLPLRNKFRSRNTPQASTSSPTSKKQGWWKEVLLGIPKLLGALGLTGVNLWTWGIMIGGPFAVLMFFAAVVGRVSADHNKNPNAERPWEHSPMGSRAPDKVILVKEGMEIPIRPTYGAYYHAEFYGGEISVHRIYTDGTVSHRFVMGDDVPHNLTECSDEGKVVDKLVIDKLESRPNNSSRRPHVVLWYLQSPYTGP